MERNEIIASLLGQKVTVMVDRPMGHLHKGMVYPINYGYITGILAGDGEEQDAYILGVREPLKTFEGIVIGAVCRKNDCEDKLVVAPEGTVFHQGEIAQAVAFQEQYFDAHIVSLFRKSCGVLPYRVQDGEREFLIVYESFSQCWSLPKGHMEAGETPIQTAVRELLEETGLTAEIDETRQATITYPISPKGRKEVVFFLGKVSGTPKVREGEIDTFRWVKAWELGDYLFPDTVAACQHILYGMS